MVTHAWTGLFTDLVAAVVADALVAEDYGDVATTLASGEHQKLVEDLRRRGTLNATWGICVFCINQHASICGGFAHEPCVDTADHATWDKMRRDSVTGEIFPLCNCQRPKCLNDRPDECELNKFDSVMARLQQEVRGFRQLVAVDRDFKVFGRIWCVAELVQAYRSRMSQAVQLCSRSGLCDESEDLELYIQLATLTVAKAEATRPEDKSAILAKISDIPEFDANLQAVIFGDNGLLSKRFTGFGALEAAANTARRVKVLLSTGSLELVTCTD